MPLWGREKLGQGWDLLIEMSRRSNLSSHFGSFVCPWSLLGWPLWPGLAVVAFLQAPVQCAVRKVHIIQRTGWFSRPDHRISGYLGLEGTHKDRRSPASGPAKTGVWNQDLHCKSFPGLGCCGIFILTCKKVASFFIQRWWCKYKNSEEISSKISFWLKKHRQVLHYPSICFFLIRETCNESEEACIFSLALLAVFQNHEHIRVYVHIFWEHICSYIFWVFAHSK